MNRRPSFKYRFVNALIMNIPIALSISLAAQLLATGTVNIKLLLINFGLAYLISLIVGLFIPCVPWGIGFARLFGAKPGSLPFGLLLNVVVNFVYVLVNSIILTWFNICVMNHGPIQAVPFGILSTFIPLYIVGYIVSFLWNKPAENITHSIVGE